MPPALRCVPAARHIPSEPPWIHAAVTPAATGRCDGPPCGTVNPFAFADLDTGHLARLELARGGAHEPPLPPRGGALRAALGLSRCSRIARGRSAKFACHSSSRAGGSMRYTESKEQSSELLRLALPLMARQQAALHPISYTLWYEHLAGVNPALSRVLQARLDANQLLSEDEVYELHARYIVARDMERLERLQQKLRDLLEEAAQTTASAGEDTGKFEVLLESSRSRLGESPTLEKVHLVVNELLTETARMQAATQAVSEKLEAKAQEVGVLTEQLEKAQTEAIKDPLTGLRNRRRFDRAVQEFLTQEARQDGVALLLADIDHFKQINDTHGHLLGDRVLRVIAQTLQANIKGRDLAARLGGDEFAVLLLQSRDQGAEALAEQIRLAVAAGRIRREGREAIGAVTLSIGVAIARTDEPFESLYARADAELYRAKHEGRNRVCAAGPGPEPGPTARPSS